MDNPRSFWMKLANRPDEVEVLYRPERSKDTGWAWKLSLERVQDFGGLGITLDEFQVEDVRVACEADHKKSSPV